MFFRVVKWGRAEAAKSNTGGPLLAQRKISLPLFKGEGGPLPATVEGIPWHGARNSQQGIQTDQQAFTEVLFAGKFESLSSCSNASLTLACHLPLGKRKATFARACALTHSEAVLVRLRLTAHQLHSCSKLQKCMKPSSIFKKITSSRGGCFPGTA